MSGSAGPLTLAFDIGGTHLKASVLSPDGKMVEEERKVATPHPSPPDLVVKDLVELVQPMGRYDRISIGFPGVVRHGLVLTAPNLGTDAWRGFGLPGALSKALGKPARMLNDATVQGLGAIQGRGLECVITLGTGMGFALFEDGVPGPHLELSQHVAHKEKTYDQWIGDAALKRVGRKRWLRRVQNAIGQIATLVNYDTLEIGGGNARLIKFELPPNITIVPNEAGITGGVRLWDAALDAVFREDATAA
ncbi:MAG TPA: ROK family protein [Acetobacteraceae bacterium]|jgi:polyphosphate glucokinase